MAGAVLLEAYGKQAEERAKQREFDAAEISRRIREELRPHKPYKNDRRLTLTPAQSHEYTFTAARLEGHDGHLPKFGRDHTARLRQLKRMTAKYGQLSLVTLYLDMLDAMPLRCPELARAARVEVRGIARHVFFRGIPYTVDIQRGIWDGTHAHVITPMTALIEVDRVRSAGRDGWIIGEGLGHAVAMGLTAKDLEKVARYICRAADARLSDRTAADFLDSIEDELQRLAMGQESPRLSWEKHVRCLN
ncbi:hypothetical protein Dxin01_01324 [Deinococcus xinjiangensis]|uniref:Uncharacterized protein n=2 Tax=Deinococcus xinjiangensis TaxID=457454 RepID=A0ABP9VC10_9DEIO